MELKNLGQTAASALIHMDIRLEREHWTMFRNKIFGIAAAATLGSAAMLGTPAANAVIDLDATDKTAPSATYAKESLKAKVDDDSMYYVVTNANDAMDVSVALGVAGAGVTTDDVIITYTLEGMVFNTPLTDASISAGITGPSLSSGGMKNDTVAIFAGKRGDSTSGTDVVLEVTDFGIMSDGSGSISVTIINLQQRAILQNVPGVEDPGTKMASYPGAVAVKSGVKATATPNDLMATVSNSFQSFGLDADADNAPILTATLGSFTVGLAAAAAPLQRAADDGAEISGDAGALVAITGTTVNTVGDNDSSVTIMGDFSFVANAWLDSAADCTTTGTDLRVMDSANMVTDTTKLQAQALGYVLANPNLCITVPAHTAEMPVSIPAASYRAMVSYKAGTEEGMMLPADASYDLGKITRDGTTIRLPYVSTHDKFHQRIRIVNRSSVEVRYEMEFHGEDDMAGADATGMLGANSIMVLSLSDNDVVTPGNGNNTSATIIVEAPPTMIDVATVQVNRTTGASDTVVYSAE